MEATHTLPLFDPEIESMICTVVLAMDMILILLILFFSFLAVKIDGRVEWAWATVWIPLWLIHVFIAYALGRYILSTPNNDGADDKNDDKDERQRFNDDEAMEGDKRRRQGRKRMQWITRGLLMMYFILALLFQIFIVLTLDQKVAWSATVIFIPYFVLEGLNLCLMLADYGIALMVIHQSLDDGGMFVSTGLSLIFHKFWLLVLRLVLFVLMALRIDGTITCSWAVVFIPLYLVAVKYAIQLGLSYRRFSRLPQPEVAQQGKVTVLVGMVAFVVVGTLVYALIGLVARRLDGAWYLSMATVFVPVFIILAVVTCCCGCCLPCLMMISTLGDLDDMESAQALIDPNRRITQSGEILGS
ncbi:hypothetical protein BC941DRAFT_492634 [Chlamydoabsidia padenii]|nr:hypothetical protein BC941DRAFT_492634 [Chlamydoabsidia padenii]